jgi:hypothetical protein
MQAYNKTTNPSYNESLTAPKGWTKLKINYNDEPGILSGSFLLDLV